MSSSHDSTLKVWDAGTGRENSTVPHRGLSTMVLTDRLVAYGTSTAYVDQLELEGMSYGQTTVTASDDGFGLFMCCATPSAEGHSKNHSPFDELGMNGSTASSFRFEGLMFWLIRKKLSGSYFSLRATSRSYF